MTISSLTKRILSSLFLATLFFTNVNGEQLSELKYHPGGDEYEAADDAPFLPAIVRIDSEEYLESLLQEGSILLRRRGDLALMFLRQEDSRESLRKNVPGHPNTRVARGKIRRVTPAMDFARECFGASRILSGESLPKSYSGNGIVVGICDIGFDPSHSNFTDPNTGESRIKRIVQYKEAQGQRILMESPDEYSVWVTDTTDHYHATHVAGILAGSDNSAGYGGIASGADIVVTTSQLSDVGLLAGVEDIIEYARSVGKPAVVNLSMGCYTGPHDGSSLFSQYMNMLGEEAVICLSSGNSGNQTNTVSFTFTPEQTSIGQRLHNFKWTQFDIEGMTDIWGADSRSFSFTPVVFDETSLNIVYSFPEMRLSGGETRGFTTLPDNNRPGFTLIDDDFRRYFSGWFEVSGEVNPDNGRYNIAMQYELHTDTQSDAGAWARYNIAFLLEGEPGQHVDIYSDGITTRLRQMPGSPAPDSSFSVSDLATGNNVICVGMYNSRSSWPLIDGGEGDGKVETATVSIHSSYGTLLDGRVLPHTVAPGNPIISSFSRPYLDAHPDEKAYCAAVTEAFGSSHYWGMEGGTSMSSPYVAGFIATLLEADPSLGVSEIKDLIQSTNRHDIADPNNPRHGQGWFDPYSIMTKVVRNISVPGNIDTDIRAAVSHGELQIHNPDNTLLSVTISDTGGRALHSASGDSALFTLSLDKWKGQILLIQIQTINSPPQLLKVAV